VLVLNDPAVSAHVAASTGSVLIKAQAGHSCILSADRLVESSRHGDVLPHHLGAIVGLAGSIVFYGVFKAVEGEAWQALLLWCTVAFIWFRAIGWASSTGSGLAHAMQGA
jgi:hypothetical protein